MQNQIYYYWLLHHCLFAVKDHVNSLCQQAKGLDSNRLDQKIVHGDVRKIYESFRNTNDTTINGLPGNLLSKLIHREFDFEESVSLAAKKKHLAYAVIYFRVEVRPANCGNGYVSLPRIYEFLAARWIEPVCPLSFENNLI